ncbi:MAG: LCP family protein [Solirubrobacteraceae bacterium]|nr:LCP family protein [Solirubrobacteraceae bacterium]
MPAARRRHWPRYLLALTTVVLLTAGASAFAVINAVPLPDPEPGKCTILCPGDGELPLPTPAPGRPMTMLLIGSDARIATSSDGDVGRRSDTIMLARIGGGRPTTLLSIPRDLHVTIPLKGGGSRIGKINEAFSEGGPELTEQVVRDLLDIDINHIAVIDFEAFQRAVNRLGCLYEDVDRSYFNDRGGPGGYATIDVKSGYQLLCGGDTLDWVRYRHTDSDLVRGARQQAFVRAAKVQVAASKLFENRTDFIKIFQRYVHTTIKTRGAMIGVIKSAAEAAGEGTRTVPFIASDGGDAENSYLVTSPADIAKMRAAFLANPKSPASSSTPTPTPKATSRAKRSKSSGSKALAPGLQQFPADQTQSLTNASFQLAGKLPVYYPAVRLSSGGWADRDPVRAYGIQKSRYSKGTYPAWRLTFSAGDGPLLGQYYGVQGTTWKDAPILSGTHHEVRRNGRTLQVYLAGTRAQIVSWTTSDGVFWVSNTLSQSLTTRQMIDIAASLRRVPG